jgi:glycine/D-amino acid oxidase-like deaminating enzyme
LLVLPAWVRADHVASRDIIGTRADTAQVHPGLLTRNLMSAAERAGARLVRQRVVGVDLSGDAVKSVRLADGTAAETEVLVLAMGPWTGGALSAWFGLASGLVGGTRAHSILLLSSTERSHQWPAIDATALFLDYSEDYTAKSLHPEAGV